MGPRTKIIDIKVRDELKHALVTEGLVSEKDLRTAEARARAEGQSLTGVLVSLGHVTSERLMNFIGESLHIPYVNVENYTIDHRMLDIIPEDVARSNRIIPLFKVEDVLTIAMSDPLDIVASDNVSSAAKCTVEPVLASEGSIMRAIDQWYGAREGRKALVDELAGELKWAPRPESGHEDAEAAGVRGEQEKASPSVIKLVNGIMAQAILAGASDIHFEPKKDCLLVRFRIDGFLYPRHRLGADLMAPVASRVKVMSGMDISRKRTPQDGRMELTVRDRVIAVRASTFPSMYGENVVLRILDKTRGFFSLVDLGLSSRDLDTFKTLIKSTRGMILSTGPTGSGKTTTIYSLINALDKARRNVMSIEDPIEYEIEGVVQSQVAPGAGVTFAGALRSILRQDPDVIYVGEIRDSETALVAVHAALTGHLVFSTLHSGDAAGAFTRLHDLGVDRRLIGSVVNCTFAQRLVRRICRRCSAEYTPDDGSLDGTGVAAGTRLYRGKGCRLCNDTGYMGRAGIFEIVTVGGELQGLITKGASEGEVLEAAKRQGTKTLLEDGLEKVSDGTTTLEEVRRVLEDLKVTY